MSEVLKQIISNGTNDARSCKSRAPFSIVPEDVIRDAVNSVYNLSGVFYEVSGLNLIKEEIISGWWLF